MRRILILIVLLGGSLIMIGCQKITSSFITREEAALTISNEFGFEDYYDLNFKDLDKNSKNTNNVLSVLSRKIFGETNESYSFRYKDILTEYELVKISLSLYAYLLDIEEHTLEPGEQIKIKWKENLEPLQKWNVYSALSYGFIELENNTFDSKKEVNKDYLLKVITNVKNKVSKITSKTLVEHEKQLLENFKMTPKIDVSYSSTLDIYKPNNNRGERLFGASLQGLVNRDKVSIYVDTLSDLWIVDYAIQNNYFTNYKVTEDIYSLFEKYYGNYDLNKFVVVDMAQDYNINLASDIASVENRLIITLDMVDRIKGIVGNSADFLYIDELNIHSQYDSVAYAYQNYYPFMRRDILGFSYYGHQQDFSRDYTISLKIPNLWVPGSSSIDYDSKTILLVSQILARYPYNIPVVGFSYAALNINGTTFDMGIGEFTGVSFLGEYGKYSAVFDTAGNLTFSASFNIDRETLKVNDYGEVNIEYNPNKKYIAMSMTESGDSPAYIEYGLNPRQWRDAERPNIKYNYSYGLINIDLLPLHTKYFFESATENNYFFGSISGLGYMYPLVSYGSKGVVTDDNIKITKETILKDHYTKANEIMRRVGFEALGVYGYPDNSWSNYDYMDFTSFVLKYMPNLKMVMADMHRPVNVNNALPIHETMYNQRIYHCTTYWSLADLGSSTDVSKDSLAVDYLVTEIFNHTKESQFNFAMAYSWHYSSRRIKLVFDRLNELYPNTYELVTIKELDYLYLHYGK